MSFFSKIFGDSNNRYIVKINLVVEEINKLEHKFERFSSEELKNKSLEIKNQAVGGKPLDSILPEAFALVREATKRTLNQRHFDVQLIGGIALHQGKVVEMRTGEGKTLTATLPVYLNALTGKGVHVVTVNDYLARRDVAWMGQIYSALGLTVGCVNTDASYLYDPFHASSLKSAENSGEDLDSERDTEGSFKVVHEFLRSVSKKEAYEADIVYGTNNEFGFDYLRDNMAYDLNQKVQAKGYNFVIIDEVDSILIDEARTPLIISAPDADSGKMYEQFSKITPRLKEYEDYNVDEKLKAVTITESGIEKVEKTLGLSNIYEEGGTRYVHHLEQALKAAVLFTKDKDYVVKDGQIVIVDEFTGRLMPGRRWSEGLHQAIEAKEGVKIQKESRTLATITFQNYFRHYKKISGMTGTAMTSSEEFHQVYGMDVIQVPTNKPMVRQDYSDVIYKNEQGKLKSLVEDIKWRHQKGQPILIGTVSIQKNEMLSAMLKRDGIPHQLLNAKNHEKEAEIIAQAGRLGAVTVATNMAGRGVDIILGGNPFNPEEAKKVKELGGLHVIGTERHEARRIDNQLRGRAGRQGDPGSSQFFISAEDDVMRVFGGDRLKNLLNRIGMSEDEAIENRLITKAIEQAQIKIEGFHFDTRKYVLEYDNVMNRHRTSIYKLRNQILESANSKDLILEYTKSIVEGIVNFHFGEGYNPNVKEIYETIKTLVSPTELSNDFNSEIISLSKTGDFEELKRYINNEILTAYEKREKELGREQMERLGKLLLLRVIDELWMDHLEAMEYLRDSVRLRAYGQRDPLAEYKVEGQKMFEQLNQSLKGQVANLIFKVGIARQPQRSVIEKHGQEITPRGLMGERGNNSKKPSNKIGRNDPCWCGSGKKYKKCHMTQG